MNNNSSPNITYYQNQPVSLQTNQMQQSTPSNYIMATNQQPQQQYYQQQPNNTFIQQQNGIPQMNVQKQSVTLQNGQMMPNNYQINTNVVNTNSYQTSNQMPIQVQQSVPWSQQNNQYQQYIQPQQQQQLNTQQLPQNIPSQQQQQQQQQPKQIIKMNQFILAKPATPPPPTATTVTSQSTIAPQTNQTVVHNQGQFNQIPQMIKPQINPYSQQQQQQLPQQQVNYTQNINYSNNTQNMPKQINIMPSPIQPTQQQQQYVQQQPQMSQQLNGINPTTTNGQQIQVQQTNTSFINQNNNQQTNQSAQFYTQQQPTGVVFAQIQQQPQQQVYSTFVNQPNVVQTNGISYSSPLQSNRIVYINNNNNTITSNSTVVQQTIPMNNYQTNGNNICIVQKPLNQMSNQQIVYAQTPIQPNINANNQTPNKILLNQSNIVLNQNQQIPIVQVKLAPAPTQQQTTVLIQQSVVKQPILESKQEKPVKISASVHANIESTIDDMMKQYKMESKFSQDTDTNDKSFNDESNESKLKKTPKRTNKKIKNIESAENDDSNITISKMLNNDEQDETTNDDSEFKTKTKKTPKGKKTNLAQLVKKSQKKKRKRGSSDEDEEPDDDSDDYVEKTANKSIAKKKAAVSAAQTEQPIISSDNLLTTNETGKRSVRSKKTKYTDLNDDDLLMPLTEAELAAQQEAQTVGKSNIILTSQDELIVDKILGMRLFKRKTLRKIEKPPKAPKPVISPEVVEAKETKEESKLVVDQVQLELQTQAKEETEETKSKPKIETSEQESKSQEEIKVGDEIKVTKIEEEPKPETKEEEIVQETQLEAKQETHLEAQVETQLEAQVETQLEAKQETQIQTKEEILEEEEDEESEYEEDGGEIETEEFYIKYKNISYLHCEWKSRDELYEIDKRIDQKIKRYKQKRVQHQDCWDGGEESSSYYNTDYDELFNFDYTIVDRILDVYEVEDKTRYYLVKWKSSPYDESTWEVEKDIEKAAHKIEQFYKQHKMPSTTTLNESSNVLRPRPEKWTQITESREFKNGNKLREYQLEGINWLTFCWLNRRNCILADEMGLGKTVQSVTFLNEISSYGINGPFLVLVPLSTIANWLREFETWTNFNAIVYHGSSQSRQLLQDYEFYYKANGTESNESNSAFELNKDSTKQLIKFNALITTYEVLMSDILLFNEIKWRSIIIDEAHRLKNKNCSLIKMLKCIKIEHKVLLTGTPLQNNVEELFSLLNYLDEEKYASVAEFMTEFSDLKTDTQVNKLQAILKPIMLRRLKEDVEKSLAPKEETIVEVELTNTQKKFYRAILEKNFEFLYKGSKSNSNMPKLINTMMELRKCCNHPYLINGAEQQILSEQQEQESSNQQLKAMIQSCGKLVLVDKLLPKLKANGNRVLIFSQMVRILDILEDYLIQKKYTYERLDGRIRGEARQEAIDRYSKKDSDRFVFLLCTRAGGLGINLTAADTVIIYDSDWNPQNDLQAQARVHRIGQKKSVKIYRLITRNTYEREMFDKASLKLGLDKAVLQSMRSSNQTEPQSLSSQQLSKKEIEDLLKKGAYGALMDDDKAGDNFCEEDIDKILQHRSKTIQIDGAIPSGVNPEKSTFSKASFQVNETNDISIDDPEFWQKWAQKASIDYNDKLNPKDERIIDEPRRRIQTKRFIGGLEELEKEEKEDLNDLSLDSSSSSSDELTSKSKSKNSKDLPNKWLKDECLKIEKSLLIFGWSQWNKILENSELLNKKKNKTNIRSIESVEILCRCLLVYILRNYQAVDETIKQQIQILIHPFKSLQNGLVVQLGPKTIKDNHKIDQVKLVLDNLLNQLSNDLQWANNCDDFLEDSYKKHLIRHSNRILTRLKMLSYIRQEIIGDENAQLIDSNQNESQIQIKYIDEQNDDIQSVDWWSKTCDKSLLIGVYKHGFDKYYNMRLDSSLCFLSLIGPPDPKDLLLEQQVEGDATVELVETPTKSKRSKRKTNKFPVSNELNNRLKRLITSHQKLKKQEQIQMKKEQERLEKLKSKQVTTQLEKQKWSKREEQSFIRTLYQFGVDKLSKNVYNWQHFKEISQLDKKLDHTLNDFYKSFYNQALNDDKSVKLIQRIDLFNKIRQFVLKHLKFTKWLNKCLPNNDLPDWWISGKHDIDLIKALSKYGLYKTELYYLNSKEFQFNKYLVKYSKFIEIQMLKQETKQRDPLLYYQQNQQKIKQSFLKSTNNVLKDVLNDLILDIEIENEPIVYFNNNNSIPMHLWLKEKVIIQRLEDIIQMFENNGQWPKSAQNSDNESLNLEPGEIKSKKGQQKQRQKTNNNNNLDDKSALAALFLAPGLDLNDRIIMINIDNGSRLVGNKAPKRGELSSWLLKHPNYLPDESEIIKLTNRQQSTSSEEDNYPDNLVLFNKNSGKKHQNDKITNWKHLCSYLEKNQQLFIDSSCTDLVKSKFDHKNIPEIIKSRFIAKPPPPPKVQQKVFSSNSSEASSRSSTPTLNVNKNKNKTVETNPDLVNGDFSAQLANILAAMNGQSNGFANFGNPFGQSMDIFKDLGIQMPNGFDMNQLLANSLPNANEQVKSNKNQQNNNNLSKKPSTPVPSKSNLNNPKTPINQSSSRSNPVNNREKSTPISIPNREKSTPINSSMENGRSKRSRNDTPSTAAANTNNSKKFKNESKEDVLNNPLIDQTKLLQELMNMSQFNPTAASANPFLFGANLPFLQSNLMMSNTNKSSRSSSPSNENGTDFSISPSSSISSNLPIQPPMDYNLLSNLMSLQMMNNLNPSMASFMPPSSSSLMQNDLLTNLLAAQGMNAMDPNILSMLALMNPNNEQINDPTHSNNKSRQNSQQATPRQSQRNISSNKNTPQQSSSSSSSSNSQSNNNKRPSSSNQSSRMNSNKSNTPSTPNNDRSRSVQSNKPSNGSETRSKGLDLSSNRRK